MCIFELLRMHVNQNHKISKKKLIYSNTKRNLTKHGMTYNIQYPEFMFLKITAEEVEVFGGSLQDSICCTDYIINGGNCNGLHGKGQGDPAK